MSCSSKLLTTASNFSRCSVYGECCTVLRFAGFLFRNSIPVVANKRYNRGLGIFTFRTPGNSCIVITRGRNNTASVRVGYNGGDTRVCAAARGQGFCHRGRTTFYNGLRLGTGSLAATELCGNRWGKGGASYGGGGQFRGRVQGPTPGQRGETTRERGGF